MLSREIQDSNRGGGSPQPLGKFHIFIFFARNSPFSAILIIFRTFSELFETPKFLKFKNHFKELNFPFSSTPYVQINSKTFFNACFGG